MLNNCLIMLILQFLNFIPKKRDYVCNTDDCYLKAKGQIVLKATVLQGVWLVTFPPPPPCYAPDLRLRPVHASNLGGGGGGGGYFIS